LVIDLRPVPPFRLDLTVWALKRRPDYTVEGWDGTTYRKVLLDGDRPFGMSVEQIGKPDRAVLRIETIGEPGDGGTDRRDLLAVDACRVLLGTHVDLTKFYSTAANSPHLAALASRLRGLKPPRYMSLFEALTNAITCQQITLTAGLRILDRFASDHGAPFAGFLSQGGPSNAFPAIKKVGHVSLEMLRGRGYSKQKAQALTELVSPNNGAVSGTGSYAALDDESAVRRLRQLHGVGRWTAEYALLRGLGRLNVFPGDDVGVRRHLERWLNLSERLDYAGVQQILEPWKPFAGLIYIHLVVNGIVESGSVSI
jgi:DNA-3-methyladenine glycosylase II